MNTSVVVLAAGRGQRMRSDLPKVLHQIGGRPLLAHILCTISGLSEGSAPNPHPALGMASNVLSKLQGRSLHSIAQRDSQSLVNLQPQILIVVGHRQELVKETLAAHLPFSVNATSADSASDGQEVNLITYVEQKQQLGTGDAVRSVLPFLAQDVTLHSQRVLIVNGDVPLIKQATLKQLLANTPVDAIGLLTAKMANPTGLGRIKRDLVTQAVVAIVEEKDATAAEKEITEINSGVYVIPARYLAQWLPKLTNKNAQQEFYLTDVITMAIQDNIVIHTEQVAESLEVQGVNTLVELAALERAYQRQQAEKYMLQGVRLADPARFDVRGNPDEIILAAGVQIDINVILEGKVNIAANVSIGANVCIKDSVIAEGVNILPNSVIDGASIAAACQVGPFARIRPGTELKANAKVGNFVEIKNSIIGDDSKVNHLSYIGDAEIGKRVNIGAGTITCNYDGVNKYKTVIADEVMIGSDTQLVAPVKVGRGATVGAGTTVTKDVPADKLVINPKQMQIVESWRRPEKESKNHTQGT